MFDNYFCCDHNYCILNTSIKCCSLLLSSLYDFVGHHFHFLPLFVFQQVSCTLESRMMVERPIVIGYISSHLMSITISPYFSINGRKIT